MASKGSLLPLFLLLSLSALFLLSLYRSSFSLSSSSSSAPSCPQTFNTIKPLQNTNPNSPNFVLTIKVLTYDRLASLSRCLRSLGSADYGNDRVNLHIFVDHFKIQDPSGKGAVNLDQKLNESRQILDFVDGFAWEFGEKLVLYRTGNVGLQAQWLEAWWPSSDDEFAFVVEDDLEVSPLYYKFLRALILNYYYNASNYSPWIYGASLQRPRFVPGKHGNKIQLDSGTHIFLYQLVGTWGQLLFPRPWKEFRVWYDEHKAKGIKPFLEGMVTTGWYKKMGERIWTPWFIKFIHSRGYFNIYTNFLQERALSVSHRDAGVNYGKTAGPDSFLLDKKSLNFDLLEMQPLSKLKWYDFCFRQVVPDRIVKNSNELGYVLSSVQKRETVLLVSLYGASEKVVKNLLCHFARLNIQNYIFMGSNSNLILDLARRGDPLIETSQFFESLRAHKLTSIRESSELLMDTVVKAYVIKKSLDLKYSISVVDANMLLLSNDFLAGASDPAYDFYSGKSFEMFFVRSSSSSRTIWVDGFIYEVAKMADSSNSKDVSSGDDRSFARTATRLLEQKGVKMKRVDEESFNVNMDISNVNGTSLGVGKKMVFWSSQMGLDLVQQRLRELGMWIVDGDSSCTAVYCHQS